MSGLGDFRPHASRRGLLAAAGGLVTAGVAGVAQAGEPFHGVHQGGIETPQQSHCFTAAFDLVTERREAVVELLRAWTEAAARLAAGRDAQTEGDSGEAVGLGTSRLTITFGFGAGMFIKDGKDRYQTMALRPAALIDLPRFNGDQMVAEKTGGDLVVIACADDPQVVFHAVRQLARIGEGVAEIRWAQTGFSSTPADGSTPRNLMGFKDGTQRPRDVGKAVWVGGEGPGWMRGGSYLVVRRIRMALEHWDRSKLAFQEETMGRHKGSGAPLGLHGEFEPLGLDRNDADGNPVIAEGAHVRLGNAQANGAAEILRRGYSYNDGVNFTAERWPPWRQGMEHDAGLLFMC